MEQLENGKFLLTGSEIIKGYVTIIVRNGKYEFYFLPKGEERGLIECYQNNRSLDSFRLYKERETSPHSFDAIVTLAEKRESLRRVIAEKLIQQREEKNRKKELKLRREKIALEKSYDEREKGKGPRTNADFV